MGIDKRTADMTNLSLFAILRTLLKRNKSSIENAVTFSAIILPTLRYPVDLQSTASSETAHRRYV
jgi:hypothetical protein